MKSFGMEGKTYKKKIKSTSRASRRPPKLIFFKQKLKENIIKSKMAIFLFLMAISS